VVQTEIFLLLFREVIARVTSWRSPAARNTLFLGILLQHCRGNCTMYLHATHFWGSRKCLSFDLSSYPYCEQPLASAIWFYS